MAKQDGYEQIWYDEKAHALYIAGEVNERVAFELSRALQTTKVAPLSIFVNSGGGDVYQGFALYDLIRAYPKRTTGIAIGQVCSAAILPFLACDQRVLFPNAILMIHHGQSGADEHHKEFEVIAEEYRRMDRAYLRVIKERTGMRLRKVQEMAKFSTYFSAASAVKHGFASKVLREKAVRLRRPRRKKS